MNIISPEELATSVVEKLKIDKVSKTTVTADMKTYYRDKFFNTFVNINLAKEVGCLELLALDGQGKADYQRRFNDALYKEAYNKYRTREVSEHKEALKTRPFGDFIDYYKLIPVVDVETNNKILLNPDTKKLSSVSFDVWETSLDKTTRGEKLFQKINARLIYDPYNLDSCYLEPFEDLGNILKVNTYVPPDWRTRPYKGNTENIQCPPLADKLLKHLFPDAACREYVLSWMHIALVAKNETYLVLNSAKGVGKGIFCALMKMLVGMENYVEASRGFLDSQFNKLLDKKRLVVLDEISVDSPQKVNKLKSYINRFQNIEEKFKDADRMVELFTSFIVSNNSTADIHIEADDRRFSVPDTTEVPLTEEMTQDQIRQLTYLIENEPQFAHNFGYYIFYRGHSHQYDPFSIWKGPKYERLVYTSLPNWGRFLVDLMRDSPYGTEFEHKQLRRKFSSEFGDYSPFVGIVKINDLFRNLKLEGRAVAQTIPEDTKSVKDWRLVSVWNTEKTVDDLLEDL